MLRMIIANDVDDDCSPTGKRIDSKPQLARHLGDAIDVSSFDFQKGKFIQHLPSPSISLYRCVPSTTSIVSSNSGVAGSGSSAGINVSGGGATSLPTLSGGITIMPSQTVGHNLKRKHRMGSQTAVLNLPSSSLSSSTSISSHHNLLSSCTTMTTTTPTNLPIKQQQLEFR